MISFVPCKIKFAAFIAPDKIKLIINDEEYLILEIGDTFTLKTEIRYSVDAKIQKK